MIQPKVSWWVRCSFGWIGICTCSKSMLKLCMKMNALQNLVFSLRGKLYLIFASIVKITFSACCSSSDTFNTRSVLRKKLKSPKSRGPKITKSMTSNRRSITTIFPPKTISSTGSFCPATTPCHLKTSFTHVDLIRQGRMKWVNQEIGDSGRLPSTPRATGQSSPSTMSPRTLKINPHASYIECEGLVFDSEQSFQVPTRLAESGISGIRIGASHDGKLIAVGANVSPLVILRTQPTLENARVYKETGRVSSLHFAFNAKHLVSAFEQVLVAVPRPHRTHGNIFRFAFWWSF